jgi:RNA polymerase sigma-70 factor, ECF subfamily
MSQRQTKPTRKKPSSDETGQEACPDFAAIVKESTPDSSLFEQIAACFSDRLEGYAKYYCRDETLGKDAFQDAMIAAMTYLDTYRGDSPIEPWLRRIVVSSCSRLRRGKKNDPSINVPLQPDDSGQAVDATPDQELRMMLVQSLQMVQSEMEKLEEPNRSLLQQHDMEEVPIKELAKRFDMTGEAVKSRLKRARATIREGLLGRM